MQDGDADLGVLRRTVHVLNQPAISLRRGAYGWPRSPAGDSGGTAALTGGTPAQGRIQRYSSRMRPGLASTSVSYVP
jgi:hypothetical protein